MSLAHKYEIINPGSGVKGALPLNDNHIKYLEDRGVSYAWAEYAGLRAVSSEEGAELLGRAPPLSSPGLAIPYPNQPGYARIRLDQGDVRFLVPQGREVPIYIPRECQAEGSEPLCVVEGPVKALSLVDHGFNAVGLGGTGTTLVVKGGARHLNRSWEAVTVQGRDVVVLFDSNRATNPNVARDEARLSIALERAGAKVKVAALPPNESGNDQGPDDLIARCGGAALRGVINAAVPADPIERVTSISAEQAVELLNDRPFLWSIKERGLAVEKKTATTLRSLGVREAEFHRALKLSEKTIDGDKSDVGQGRRASFYAVRDGRMCHVKSADGAAEERQELCNFVARIERDELHDDGAEKTRSFVISGVHEGGQPLPAVSVTPVELRGEMWPREKWGARAIVAAIPRASGHLLAAIQQLSNPVQSRTFTHSGWREHEDTMIFLHADGAIGASDISVRLDGALNRYKLPAAPEDATDALKVSLSFLEIADPRITAPLLCAAYRAPLQHVLYCDSTVALCGPTGSLKTTLAALVLSHFGDFDAEHLPASWLSTANALERTLLLAKDVLVAIDDFAPTRADSSDEMHRKAGQILRAIGNANNRSRLRSDCTARPDRPPRALVLSTGEDAPNGESIQARVVAINVRPGEVDLVKLTEVQKSRHRLSHAMLAYVSWLRGQVRDLGPRLERRFIELRTELYQQGQHLRAPAAIAHLLLGAELVCEFAKDLCVFDEDAARDFLRTVRGALLANAAEQSRGAAETNPVRRFLYVLRALIVQGAVCLVDVSGSLESTEGRGVGWFDDDFVYLNPDLAHAAVVRAMQSAGENMPISPRTLWRRLAEEDLALKGDEDGRWTRKKRVSGPRGPRERVIWLRREAINVRDEVADAAADALGDRKANEDDDGLRDDPGGGPSGGPGGSGGSGGGPLMSLRDRFPPIRSPEPLATAFARPDAGPQGPGPQGALGRTMGPATGAGLSLKSDLFQAVTKVTRRLFGSATSQSPEAPGFIDEGSHLCALASDVGGADTDFDTANQAALSPMDVGAPGPWELSPQWEDGIDNGMPHFCRPLPPGMTPSQALHVCPGSSLGRGAVSPGTGRGPVDGFAAAVLRVGRVGLAVRSTGPDLTDDGPRLLAIALPNEDIRVFDLFEEALGPLADVLSRVTIVGHDLKFALTHLQTHLGIEIATVFDTAIAARLIDGGAHLDDKTYFSFENVCRTALSVRLASRQSASWSGTLNPEHREEVAQEARHVLRLEQRLHDDLVAAHLGEVADLEFKLLPIVVEMEQIGVPVDRARWERILDMWATEAAELKKGLSAKLRVQSVDNTIEVLAALRQLGLQIERANSETLAPYMHLPIVRQLARYRLVSSFVPGAGEGVLRALDRSRDGRVHATLNQIGATTGRMSSEKPNLLGLPREKVIRSCITASPGKKLIIGDYSTIELRVLADQTGDEQLSEVFRIGGDPHRHTASLVMGVPEDDVTEEQRRKAKPLNFGFAFGIGQDRLIAYAKKHFNVEFTPEEAEIFRKKFFETYTGIALWQRKIALDAPGELRTRSGRIAYFPDPDEDYNARLASPIQGTAADGMKQAMVMLRPLLKPLGAKIILAIHDELLVEAPEEHAERARDIMRESMIAGMNKYVAAVPIVVDPQIRSSWRE